jgi:hypothetical protein
VLSRYTRERGRVAVTIRGERYEFLRTRIHSAQETFLHNLCNRTKCAALVKGERSWLVTGVDAAARRAGFPRLKFQCGPPFGNTLLFSGSPQRSIRIFVAGKYRSVLVRGLAAVLRNRGFWADDMRDVDRVFRPFLAKAGLYTELFR